MTVLGGVRTIGAPILIHVRVRLHVTVQHRLVDARVVAAIALVRFRAEVVAQMVLEMVFIFGDERTLRALEHLLVFYVTALVIPELVLAKKY